MSPETELWMLAVSVAAAVVPWAFSIHAKVAVIAESIQTIPMMFEQLKGILREHEERLDLHDEELKALKAPTRTDG